MSTRPTRPAPWPQRAESYRLSALTETRIALDLLAEARTNLRRHELLAEVQIADAMTALERARRNLEVAKHPPPLSVEEPV
jgi:hypothetical protein